MEPSQAKPVGNNSIPVADFSQDVYNPPFPPNPPVELMDPEFLHNAQLSSQSVGLVLEIFAGSCRLTKACRRVGLRALGIDKDPKRAENETVAVYDVCDPDQLQALLAVIECEKTRLAHAHFAPSCGTASTARERPIPGVPLHQQPQPLRSKTEPDGLSTLQGIDAQRVALANESYRVTAFLLDLL